MVLNSDATTAYVTLTPNNAILVLDLVAEAVTSIWPLGWKTWLNSSKVDFSSTDGTNLRNWNNIKSW